jgi:hypothetical protein
VVRAPGSSTTCTCADERKMLVAVAVEINELTAAKSRRQVITRIRQGAGGPVTAIVDCLKALSDKLKAVVDQPTWTTGDVAVLDAPCDLTDKIKIAKGARYADDEIALKDVATVARDYMRSVKPARAAIEAARFDRNLGTVPEVFSEPVKLVLWRVGGFITDLEILLGAELDDLDAAKTSELYGKLDAAHRPKTRLVPQRIVASANRKLDKPKVRAPQACTASFFVVEITPSLYYLKAKY